MDQGLLAAVKFYLIIPSLIMDAIYAMGPVVAPIVGLALCCVWPFIGLKDKKSA